jgi:flagellar biosynthetic protein FlhB
VSIGCGTAPPAVAGAFAQGAFAQGAFAQVHLQWFAEADDVRTEPPSALRMRTARETGQVPHSPELTAALVLLCGVTALALLGSSLVATAGAMVHHFLAGVGTAEVPEPGDIAPTAFGYIARLSLPMAAVGVAGALSGNLAQVGLRVAVRPIVPDLSRIVPRWERFRRRAFSVEAAFNLIKELLKVVIVGATAVFTIGTVLETLAGTSVAVAGAVLARAALRGGSQTAVALLALAMLDYVFRRDRQRLRLRMSPQEVRDERRRQEGDPVVGERLRGRMRELLRRTMGAQVAAADVVITHGGRRAVALRWDNTTMHAPVVVAKGMAAAARRIDALATASGVAVVEDRPLAEAVWQEVAIGDPIPEAFYRPAARLLAGVRRIGHEEAAWPT